MDRLREQCRRCGNSKCGVPAWGGFRHLEEQIEGGHAHEQQGDVARGVGEGPGESRVVVCARVASLSQPKGPGHHGCSDVPYSLCSLCPGLSLPPTPWVRPVLFELVVPHEGFAGVEAEGGRGESSPGSC